MNALHAYLIAFIQGITELFPVSSLGHAVVLPQLFGWAIDQKSEEFLPFLVVLHLGTAAALFAYFWRDWLDFFLAVMNPKASNSPHGRRVFMLICIATLPAVILGYTLQHKLRELFAAPMIAAAFLIVNGIILLVGERIKHRGHKEIGEINWLSALIIGTCQALALLPGISRSGITMVGGVLAGLRYEQAARFSFLLATPIIAGAGVLEVPKLLHSSTSFNTDAIIAGVIAGITAYLSTYVLMRYFKQNEVNALAPFGWYCGALGAVSLILLR